MSTRKLIKNKISNKLITFEQFMRLVLYDPNYGYYNCKQNIFGHNGDYITAPEISPLFSKIIACQCREILQVTHGNILEFGAGSGKMAAIIMQELTNFNLAPNKYQIIELSPQLKQLQRKNILSICPDLINKFEWLPRLPDNPWNGVILANEVLDAMPIHRFHKSEMLQEYYVTMNNNEFSWNLGDISNDNFIPYIQKIIDEFLVDVKNYDIEINFYLEGWLKSIFDLLDQGSIIIVDYGFPSNEFYHPDRSTGTLMCHYQHTTNSDPLINVGQQDITAHVNFSQLAELSYQLGFTIAGYTNQATFLLNAGILDLVNTTNNIQQYSDNQQIKLLTLPSEMGEIFKVMNLSKNMAITPSGFSQLDLRHTL